MNPVLPLLAPLAVLLPGLTGTELARESQRGAEAEVMRSAQTSVADPGALNDVYQPVAQHQVSIEQRVTIRIAPRGPATPIMFDSLPANGAGPRFTERKMGKCVPVSGIVGVQYRDASRLVLYLRDRRMVSVMLEKSCTARDFYSGFYVARNGDGQLCADRDEIRSRSGANCQIKGLRQLVEVDD